MVDRDILVFVEEPSAYEVVRAVARKLALQDRVLIFKHRGAGDLERSLGRKIVADPKSDSKYLILRDADGGDCRALKSRLLALIPSSRRARTLVRIVCQELEAWYLAQPDALLAAGALKRKLPVNILRGDVDAVSDPKGVFLRHAYDKGQVEDARRIGERLEIGSTKSSSFKHFVSALSRLAALP